jgi:hypothetical protein
MKTEGEGAETGQVCVRDDLTDRCVDWTGLFGALEAVGCVSGEVSWRGRRSLGRWRRGEGRMGALSTP